MSTFRKKHEEPEDEGWLLTYADAITQLMCFFLILLSVSEPVQSKFEDVKKGMQEEFSSKEDVLVSTPFNTMEDTLFTIVEKNNLHQHMAVGKTDKGVVLELSSGAFYQSGSAEFKPEAIPILEETVKAIVNFSMDFKEYKIEVEGHTDNVPIASAKFPSNWELAAARAARVVRFFQEKGVDPNRLKAMGMGDAYPKVPNEDNFGNPIPENQDMNRRIMVRIERKD